MTVNVTLKHVLCSKRCRKVSHSPERRKRKSGGWEFSSLSTATPRSQWRRKSTSATGWYPENLNQYLPWSIGNIEPWFSIEMLDYGACWVNSSRHASTEFSLRAEINLVETILRYNSLQLSTPKKCFFNLMKSNKNCYPLILFIPHPQQVHRTDAEPI